MSLHLHPVPTSLVAPSPTQQALELGQMILGTHACAGNLHRHRDVLKYLSTYAQRIKQHLSKESHGDADEGMAETFDILGGIINDEALPALEMFLEKQEESKTARAVYWQSRDTSRELAQEGKVQ